MGNPQSAIRNPQSAIESRLDRVSPYLFPLALAEMSNSGLLRLAALAITAAIEDGSDYNV